MVQSNLNHYSMGIGIVIMGVLLFVSVLRLWSYDRQLKEWAEQLTQTDEYSNLRLGTSVRSRAFLNCCRAVNERLERGQQARIRQESMSRELKFTISSVSHDGYTVCNDFDLIHSV